MSRDFRIQPSFSAVAAGQTATIDLPTTGVYHQLRISYGTTTGGGATQANMEAEISAIRLKVNGVVQRRMSAAELFAINGYHGNTVAAGLLPVYFSEHWRRTAQGEDSLAWGMSDVSTFQVEIDLAAGAFTPTLSATAVKELGSRPMGPIVKWRKFVVPVSAVGEVNVTTLPKRDAYYALHAFSNDVSKVLVRLDERDKFEALKADVVDYQSKQGKVPQANMFHVDFGPTGRVSDALVMRSDTGQSAADFRVDFTLGAANAFDLLTETIGLRD